MPQSQLLVFPTSNLHGTPSDELAEGALTVRSSVRALIKSVENASPNGRDYYTQGGDALREATADYSTCWHGLSALIEELYLLADPESVDRASTVSVISEKLDAIPSYPRRWATVHTNGTSVEELKCLSKEVFQKATSTEELMRKLMGPNMRDYVDGDQWQAAREQHLLRIAMLRRVGAYFLNSALEVKKQVGG